MDDPVLIESARGADRHHRLTPEDRQTEILGSIHRAERFLIPLFKRLGLSPSARILDVGCGIGQTVGTLRKFGYDAYGLEPGGRFDDVPEDLRLYVHQAYSNDVASAADFDFVMAHGVIEHVGTTDGHKALGRDYLSVRREFAESLVRLTKTSGYVLITCPNRLFPLDFQHGPHRYGALLTIKRRLHFTPGISRLTMPWHQENYLCSFGDISRLMAGCDIKPLRVKQADYVGLTTLAERPRAPRVFGLYVGLADSLPSWTWDFTHTHTLWLGRVG